MAVAVRAIAFATRPCYVTAYVLCRPRCRGEGRYTGNKLAHQHDDTDFWPLGSQSHYHAQRATRTNRVQRQLSLSKTKYTGRLPEKKPRL